MAVGGIEVLARWVATSILTEVDLEALVLISPSHTLNCFDSISDVGEVNESAALLPQCVDQLNVTILSKVLSQTLLTPILIEIPNVNISRSTAADG